MGVFEKGYKLTKILNYKILNVGNIIYLILLLLLSIKKGQVCPSNVLLSVHYVSTYIGKALHNGLYSCIPDHDRH